MKLGEMSWPEVKMLDKSDLVAVYPIAAFEQHGPHLPFLTDTMETDEVIERAAPDPAMFRVLLGRMGYFHRSRARMGGVGDGLFPQMLPMVKGHASREHILETSELAREDPGGIGVKEAAAAARIAELEEEVAALRSQLAKI